MYGMRGPSSNVGSLSLPITRSSSACARLCTCGKRTSARKREYIDDTVSNVKSVRSICEYLEERTVSEPAENEVLLEPCMNHEYGASPEYIEPKVSLMISSFL
jgi:hypothetical protein